MPTAGALGFSREVYLNDALPTGTNQVGRVLLDRDALTSVVLLAGGARTADGTGSAVTDGTLERASAILFTCNVSAQSGGTPTLDVAIQARLDGTNYENIARFSQYGAATGKKGLNVKRGVAFATELTLASDPAVGTGLLVSNFDWNNIFRVKWAIAGTTPSYTFNVDAIPFL